jgi:hypothetical protein
MMIAAADLPNRPRTGTNGRDLSGPAPSARAALRYRRRRPHPAEAGLTRWADLGNERARRAKERPSAPVLAASDARDSPSSIINGRWLGD